MNNPTIDLIHQHGSVREYKADPIPEGWIEIIITAGQRASTSSNLQTYSAIVTTDTEKKKILQEISGGQKHISQAPVFILWCADFSRLKRVCDLQGYQIEASFMENFMVAAVDAAIAMQNAALAAESMGLGICYIGALRNDPDAVIKLFDLPELVFPVAGMTLGWPKEPPFIRPRLPLGAILHRETYQSDDRDFLEEYDKEMIATGIYLGRQGESKIDPSQYGWMEHSARRSSKPSRPHLRDSIVNAGFTMK
jgi:FMN reductase (NADPH)